MDKELYQFCYNIEQANFYILNGANPVSCGVAPKYKHVYLKFRKKDITDLFHIWCKKNKQAAKGRV